MGEPVCEKEIVEIGMRIAGALQDAHEYGVLHGDP